MLALVVIHPDWPGPRRFLFPLQTVSIGTARSNELTLSGPNIDERHASFTTHGNDTMIRAISQRFPTFRGTWRVPEGINVRERETVTIGAYRMNVSRVVFAKVSEQTAYAATDPREQSLLQAAATGDAHSRVVYADWLEQHGELPRASFLRVQDQLVGMRPDDVRFGALTSQLSALAAQIAPGWRIQIATPSVERCGAAFDFRCPMTWSALQPTARDGVRHCNSCQRDVYYALSVGEARAFARSGHCVALDAASARWPQDLAEPFGRRTCASCRADIGDGYRADDCPSCGYKREDFMSMSVGRIA
jgi:uncharacterized protein (TIGR02996 family)